MKLLGLKKVRETFGFTMRELADKLDVTPNTINLWEKGKIDVTESRITQLYYFFKVSPEILFKEEHSIEELMTIEIARTSFKLEEYREQITDEKKMDEIGNWIVEFNMEDDRMEYFKATVKRLGSLYSRLDWDQYCTFDDNFNELLDLLVDEQNDESWFKADILVECLSNGEQDGDAFNITSSNRDEYMIDKSFGMEREAIITIREKLSALYKKKLYENELYKPTWELEREKRKKKN